MKLRRIGGLLLALAAAATLFATPAQATQGTWQTSLENLNLNGGSRTDAFYDTVLKITWLRDADVNGRMDWATANAWANNLTYGGYDDWRLPTMVDTGTSGCTYSVAGGTDCGYNVQTFSEGTVYSEMAHLSYVTLGNKGKCTPGYTSCTVQANWGMTNVGAFEGMDSFYYWSGLELASNSTHAWYFNTSEGFQAEGAKTNSFYAMAVRSGDIALPGSVPAETVPEPGTLALAAAALAGLGVVRRWRAVQA